MVDASPAIEDRGFFNWLIVVSLSNPSVVRFLVRVFASREDGGEGVGGGEDFWREVEDALEGAAARGGFAGGFGLGRGGAGEVFVPELHVVVEVVVVATPAGGDALGFVEPGDEVEAVHSGEAGLGLGEVLLAAGEQRMPDDGEPERDRYVVASKDEV